MIEDCITKQTKIFEIQVDKLIEFNETDIKRFSFLAENISRETGVPQNLIYTPPYFFFLDRWHKIHDLWYFYKSDDYDFHFINELLGEVISEYFGLDTVHYHVASLCVKDESIRYGLVSKNFCTPNYQYKRSWDYGFSPRKYLDILKEVQSICHSEKEYLLLVEDLKKFFIRDFYTSQLDRSGNNFLFQQTPSGIRLAPLYDYENSFETSYVDVYRNQIAEINLQNPETLMILKKDSKFQELLHLLMQSDMSSFLNEVEERHQIRIPSEYKTDYRSHTSEVKKLIVEKKLL